MDAELIKEIIEYVEDVVKSFDAATGYVRDLDQLIEDGEMPDFYFQLKKMIGK